MKYLLLCIILISGSCSKEIEPKQKEILQADQSVRKEVVKMQGWEPKPGPCDNID